MQSASDATMPKYKLSPSEMPLGFIRYPDCKYTPFTLNGSEFDNKKPINGRVPSGTMEALKSVVNDLQRKEGCDVRTVWYWNRDTTITFYVVVCQHKRPRQLQDVPSADVLTHQHKRPRQ